MRLTRDGVLTAIIVVAALFVGSQVVQLIPSPDEQFGRPFEHRAAVGDAVELRTGTVRVTGLRSGTELVSNSQAAATGGVWVVADVEWVTEREPAPLIVSELRLVAADGRTFGGTAPVTATCGPGQPHIPLSCEAPFEVPADALEGAQLHVPAALRTELDDLAIIDLGITAERAAELGAPTEAVVLAGVEERP